TVTTVFTPEPTCFAPSNLWLTSQGCKITQGLFSSHPTLEYSSLTCSYTVLGPPPKVKLDDYSCYPYNAYTSGGTAWSDCPESMTAAEVATLGTYSSVTVVRTVCCPSAYSFVPTANPILNVYYGVTYEVSLNSAPFCQATEVTALSDQVVTLTVSTSPLITTEATWVYNRDAILAEPANIYKSLYEDAAAGTTSTCYGGNCPPYNRLASPTPTPTPTSENAHPHPPSHPVTRYTPPVSCLDSSHFWLVSSDLCSVSGASGYQSTPAWLECALTEFGSPGPEDTACWAPGWGLSTVDGEGTATYYSECAQGYSPALVRTTGPFDQPPYLASGKTPTLTFDAVATMITCCPSNEFGFTYQEIPAQTTTVHDGKPVVVGLFLSPFCMAQNISALSGKEVVLTMTSDGRAHDKRADYQTTTRSWDFDHGAIFAQAMQVSYTVFHETYTCFESCSEYFSSSYYVGDPNH
ncbi:hypothetical protein GQ53DRAFT_604359, partial [Thozetella sp. PMI_491]